MERLLTAKTVQRHVHKHAQLRGRIGEALNELTDPPGDGFCDEGCSAEPASIAGGAGSMSGRGQTLRGSVRRASLSTQRSVPAGGVASIPGDQKPSSEGGVKQVSRHEQFAAYGGRDLNQPSPPSREGTTPLTLALNPTPKGSTTRRARQTRQTRQLQLQHHHHRLKLRHYLECGLKPQRSENGSCNLTRCCVRVVRGPWPLARSVPHPPYFIFLDFQTTRAARSPRARAAPSKCQGTSNFQPAMFMGMISPFFPRALRKASRAQRPHTRTASF
jgi:hypothetical protein